LFLYEIYFFVPKRRRRKRDENQALRTETERQRSIVKIQRKIQFSLMGLTLALLFGGSGFLLYHVAHSLARDLGYDLQRAATLAAPRLSGDLHENISSPDDEAFRRVRAQLDRIRRDLDLPHEHLYTIRRRDREKMEFVVMTHPSPFVGHTLDRNTIMDRVLRTGRPAFTGIYETETGRWISAFAPIRNDAGEIAGLLEADYPYDRYRMDFLQRAAPITGVILTFFALFFVFSGTLARRIARPLRLIRDRMRALAEGDGDLTKKLDIPGSDEIAETAQRLEVLLGRVAELVRDGKRFAASVRESSERLQGSGESLQRLSAEGAALIEEAVAANEEIGAALREIHRNAESQDELIREARPDLDGLLRFLLESEQSAGQLEARIREARERSSEASAPLQELADRMERMEAASRSIDQVVGIVEEIADKVALLSLNASIEAARAGDFGRGFAVVAREIGRLSEDTGSQIRAIAEIAESTRSEARGAAEIAKRSRRAHETVDQALEESASASALHFTAARKQREPAEHNLQRLARIAELAHDSTGALAEQTSSAQDVERSMSTLGQYGDETARLAEDLRTRLASLHEEAAGLDHMLQRLRT